MSRWLRRRAKPLDEATRELVLQCLEVEPWSQLYLLVRDHPELLDERVDRMLKDLAKAAPQHVDDVATLRHILQRAREDGPADAFLETTMETRRDDAAFVAAMEALEAAGRRGDPDETVTAARAALAMVDREVDPATWAALVEALAAGLFQLPTGDREANLRAAYQYFTEALAIYRPRADPVKWAAAHHALVQVAEEAGAVDAAIEHLEAALETALEAALHRSSPAVWAFVQLDTSRMYLARGLASGGQPDLVQAAEHAGGALDVYSRRSEPYGWARAHGLIATALHRGGGSPADAAYHAKQALRAERDPGRVALLQQITAGVPRSRPPEYDAVMAGVAQYEQRHDPLLLEQVVTDGEQALSAGSWGDDPTGLADLQLMLGLAYTFRVLGDRADNIERAIALLEVAAEATRDRSRLAGIADALGTCFVRRVHGSPEANRERAIGHYEESLAWHEASGDRFQWAMTQRNLATAYWNPENPAWAPQVEKAIERSRLALDVLTREDHPYDWSGVHVNLAAYYKDRSEGDRAANVAQAVEHGRLALEVRNREQFPADWAQIQLNLAGAHLAGTDLDHDAHAAQAVEHLRMALEVYRPDTNPHECRRLSRQLGDLLFSERDWAGAGAAYRDALAATELLYDSALFRRSRDLEIVASGDLHHRLAYAEARAGRPEAAATTVEIARGRALRERLGEDGEKLALLQAADPGLLQSYLAARHALEYLEKWERSAEGTPVVEMTADQADRFVKSLDVDRAPPMHISLRPEGTSDAQDTMRKVDRDREARTRAEYQAARSELDGALTRIRSLPGLADFGADPTFEDVAAAVAAGVPLAYLVVTPAGAVALLVRRAAEPAGVEVDALWSDFTSADLGAILGGEEGAGYLRRQASVADLVDVLDPALDRLGTLVRPLAERLRELGHRRVALIPAGWLGTLPLHAARWEEDGLPRFLIDEADVTYVPSAHAIQSLQRAAAARADLPAALCGVADPQPSPTPLPYARDELEAAAELFPATRAFYGEQATRANLLGALPGATHLHLACHGVNDWANPLFSHFELPDDRLDMRDVRYGSSAAFGTLRLAVLSACESAIASLRLPDEMIGLPSALLLAGVPATIGTLWQAPDLPSALLMIKFYELLRSGADDGRSLEPMRALCRAQVWLRDATLADLRDRARRQERLAAGVEAELGDMAPGDRPFHDSPALWAPFAAFGL